MASRKILDPLFKQKPILSGTQTSTPATSSVSTPVVGPLWEQPGERLTSLLQSAVERSPKPLVQSFKRQAEAFSSRDPVEQGVALASVFVGGLSKTPPGIFKGFTGLSTKLLEKLKGRTTVSKQFIEDLTNQPDLKQAERDLIRRELARESDEVNVVEFAGRVQSELLPLERGRVGKVRSDGSNFPHHRYENVALPREARGPIANYSEHIYESPFTTSAGDIHFSGNYADEAEFPNYFAHTRIEDLPDKKTRRVIEAQSDLFQKGRLESERLSTGSGIDISNRPDLIKQREKSLASLEPYRNTWHERIIREEVKQAAKDGKTKLQFPTGETAMKIEGLGESNLFRIRGLRETYDVARPEQLKVGLELTRHGEGSWIITDVLGDGKFKAVNREIFDRTPGAKVTDNWGRDAETFDISGKVDTNNPIYRFYEKEVGRYLANKYGSKLVTDPQGVKWWEVAVKPEQKRLPVEAFGALAVPALDERQEAKRGRIFTSPNQNLFIKRE